MFGMRPRATIATRPMSPLPATPGGPQFGTVTGWRPAFVGATANAQTGAFAGTLLTQSPTNLPGIQLGNPVAGLRSNWYYPMISVVPQFQQTQRMVNISGAQRFGYAYSGPAGPVQARAASGRVTTAQVRQSGVAAMQWARSLSNGIQAAMQPTDQ